MPTQRSESCALVAEVRWRRLALRCLVHVTRASRQIVLDSWQQTSSRIAQTECAGTPGPSRQPVGLDGCVRQETWRMRRHHELFPLSCIDRSQRGKGQDERKEERGYHDQPKSRTDYRGCLYQGERGRGMSEVRPRTSGLQHRFGTDSTLPWMEPRRNPLYIDRSVPQRGRRPWRVAEYQPYRSTHRIHLQKRLDGPGVSFGGKPSLGTGTIRSMATSPSTVSASPVSTTVRDDVDIGSLARATRRRRIHSGPVEYGHGNGTDWCVTAQSNTTPESESMNHQQDWCGNAQSNDKVNHGPVLAASHVLKERPLRSDRKTKFQSSWRRFGSVAFGHAAAHCPCFGLQQKPETGLASSNVLGQNTLLGSATERVKLGNGSRLIVMDDSDLTDFIHHHAWFEGDEVALPRGDRVYLLGNLTGQTPKNVERHNRGLT